MIAAPIWLLVLSAMLHRIECMYEAPQPAQQPQQQQQQPLSPAAQYAALAPNYFGDVLATGGNTNADADDSLLSASDETLPFAGPNQLLLTGMEKRMKPSLSISNSLDVLRQQVMLDFARRQMRENIKQIEMNRAHLNSIGKRAGSGGSAGQRSEMGVERSTRQHAMRLAPSGKDDMYRVRFQQQQQQQQQHRQRQPIDGFADLD